jgi:amino acid adenylation domain-containing protein
MSSTTNTCTGTAEEANPAFASLIHLLRQRAQDQPERRVYTFLRDGERDEVHLTYGQLEREARAIAAWLLSRRLKGERVLLLYPPGLEYVAAFWGCLYAGAVAVPASPPRRLERLQAIVEDSQAAAALTNAAMLARLKPLTSEVPALRNLDWLATEELERTLAEDWREPRVDGSTLAFLQYTSGSTASPKGVRVTHGNLLHNEEMIKRAFRQSEDSVIVGWLPLYHDMGLIGNVLQPLYVGGRCILMSPLAFLQKPARWLQAITRYRATTSGGPNFAYDLCVRKIGAEDLSTLDLSSWSAAFNGAEPVRGETLEQFAKTFEPYGFRRKAFYPCYGLAEATLLVSGTLEEREPIVVPVRKSALEKGFVAPECAGDERDVRRLVGCGGALAGQQVIIVNAESQRICAAGEVGEIWVSGPSVADGYWNRPEETARTFVESPAGTGAGPYLRTGDLGFFHDGELFVNGRLKDLIIIRGRNLHPNDIERAMEKSHAALRPGCGVAFSIEVEDEERLVLVQEVERRASPDYEEVIGNIRQALAEEFEVQAHAVALVKAGQVPKTSSGKLRRRAAREMFLSSRFEVVAAWQAESDRRNSLPGLNTAHAFESEAGVYGVEQVADYLRAQLASVLGLNVVEIDARQPLTRFGIDSLLAVELSHRLETALGVELPLASLLQGSSVLELAAEAHRQLECARAAREVSAEASTTATRRSTSADASAAHPLSHGQQALWFLHRMAPDSAAYNVSSAMRVHGRLDSAVLRRAFEKLVARHAALRTTFDDSEGTPVQRVHESLPAHFEEVDATSWSDAVWRQWLAEQAHRPFNLGEGPLLRVSLLSRSEDEHLLLVVAHHIVVDFWSLAVLLGEMGGLYEAESKGSAANLARLPVQYTDYVRRQTEMLEGGEGERLWNYWERQLGSDLPALELPYDRPRPPVQTYRGATHAFKLSAELTRGLKELGQGAGATLYMVLLSAFQVLLQRYSGQDEFATGSPSAARNSAALAGVVGYFVNPLVIRADLSGNPRFVEHLARVRQTVLDAFAHQDYPFALLVQRLQPDRDASRTPLFQAMFVMQQAHLMRDEGLASFALGEEGGRIRLGELVLESVALERRVALFDLRLSMTETGETLAASLEYNTDLFDAATMERMALHFEQLLASIAAAPQAHLSQLTLLSDAERQLTLVEWNETRVVYEDAQAPLHQLVEAQVARTPDAVALVSRGERLTYSELNARADRLAQYLRAHGVGPETVVALCCERTAEMVVALLGILKAGGAYLPLDPSYPSERLAFMLEDSRPRLILTQHSLRHRLPATEALPVICLDSQEWREQEAPRFNSTSTSLPTVNGANLAYLIYTSGSTGRPKGVAIEHRSAATLLLWAQQHFTPAQLAGVLASTSICFDLSVFELFVPLACGGTVILATSVLELPELEASREVTLINTVPSALTELLRAGGVPEGVVTVNLAGEPLQNSLAQRAYQEAGVEQVLNLYGPSEDTTYSTWALVEKGSTQAPTIGRPLANTRVYLLDGGLQPVGQGLTGELYLGGEGLARGYLRRPGLTAERFIPDPFSSEGGARLYRTGDLARYVSDGRIEYLGRADNQVKVRGYRIELGEVEAALAGHEAVEEAVVIAREGAAGDKQLAAYFVEKRGAKAETTAEELRGYLEARLPKYMVPSYFVRLEALPLTPNGKVDRKALLDVGAEWVGSAGEYLAPRNAEEELLAGVFAEVLGRTQIGVLDNFFETGGHSLLATQVISRVRELFRVELPLRSLFETPTVAGLASRIDNARRQRSNSKTEKIEPFSRHGNLPLSFAQERLWFWEQLQPLTPTYNLASAFRLRGELDAAALEQSFNEIVRRHEVLRTSYTYGEGVPGQTIAPSVSLKLNVFDLSDLPEAAREAEARRVVGEEGLRPFDLTQPPLLRVGLLRLSAREHVAFLSMHHIISDGWSIGVLVNEVAELYDSFRARRPPTLPELPIQYADFAAWQRGWLRGEMLETQLAYWKEQLRGAAQLKLPADRERPAVFNPRGASLPVEIPQELLGRLKELSRREGVTLYMTLLAAFQVLLQRYTAQDDIVVGADVANRTRLETERLIGFFVNMLVLRTDLSGDPSFGELLSRVREVTLEAYAHQDVPFAMLVDELHIERELSRNPLFQVVFVLQNAPLKELELPGLKLAPFEFEARTSPFDLVFSLTETPGGLSGSLTYSTGLFEEETIRRMARHYLNVLEGVVADAARPLSGLRILQDGEVGDLKPEDFSRVKLSHKDLENLFLELGESDEDDQDDS